jgi:DNA-binding HxlR family transcriptional regulator
MEEVQITNLRQATRALQLLQGKWTLQILYVMCGQPVRLSELKRALPFASKKSLTSSLRSLEAGRIVVRKDLSATLLHVEYSLSEGMGTSITALLNHVIAWGAAYEENLVSSGASPTGSKTRDDGRQTGAT